MPKIRAQYHLRKTKTGIDAWNVRRLIELSKELPVQLIDPNTIVGLRENYWYFHDPDLVPSPLSIMDHMKLIDETDLGHPIILDEAGRVMDGMHRVCKAVLAQIPQVAAVQFASDPDPDFVNCDHQELHYDA